MDMSVLTDSQSDSARPSTVSHRKREIKSSGNTVPICTSEGSTPCAANCSRRCWIRPTKRSTIRCDRSTGDHPAALRA
jgi:hypothetical protein